MRVILILDMTFTLKMYQERQLQQALDSLKLGGYFDIVISVHPLAGLFETGDSRFGDSIITQLNESHMFVEGKIGASKFLRFMPPLNFLLAQIKLIKMLILLARETKLDVIRIGDPYYLGLIGLFLKNVLKVPLVIRVGFRFDEIFRVTGKAVNPRLFRYRWVEKLIERFVFPRCDLIAGANEDNMRYGLENGGRLEAATVFRYGNLIHPNHWQDPSGRDTADEALAVLGLLGQSFVMTVARLEPMKFVEDAIRAVAELRNRGQLFKLLLVGDGSMRNDLGDLAFSLGAAEEVIFAGNQTQEWLAKVLPKATVILSPHMGRALTEAALAGVPIVAYDYDWQREVIIDGETGYLVPHKDWMGLADKAQFVLTHPDIGMNLGKNIRNKALEMMNPARLERHEQSEYTKMLKRLALC